MSPNVCLAILIVAGFVLGLLGCLVVSSVCDSAWTIVVGWTLSVILAALVLWACLDLYIVATGKAHYEKLDNPDGTRTWHRVEVTK